MSETEEILKDLLPLYDVLERLAYTVATLEGDEERLRELERSPNIEEIRKEIEN